MQGAQELGSSQATGGIQLTNEIIILEPQLFSTVIDQKCCTIFPVRCKGKGVFNTRCMEKTFQVSKQSGTTELKDDNTDSQVR